MEKTSLPPTKVEVKSGTTEGLVVTNVNLSREGAAKEKLFTGIGKDNDEATKDVIEKIFDDKTSGEYIS